MPQTTQSFQPPPPQSITATLPPSLPQLDAPTTLRSGKDEEQIPQPTMLVRLQTSLPVPVEEIVRCQHHPQTQSSTSTIETLPDSSTLPIPASSDQEQSLIKAFSGHPFDLSVTRLYSMFLAAWDFDQMEKYLDNPLHEKKPIPPEAMWMCEELMLVFRDLKDSAVRQRMIDALSESVERPAKRQRSGDNKQGEEEEVKVSTRRGSGPAVCGISYAEKPRQEGSLTHVSLEMKNAVKIMQTHIRHPGKSRRVHMLTPIDDWMLYVAYTETIEFVEEETRWLEDTKETESILGAERSERLVRRMIEERDIYKCQPTVFVVTLPLSIFETSWVARSIVRMTLPSGSEKPDYGILADADLFEDQVVAAFGIYEDVPLSVVYDLDYHTRVASTRLPTTAVNMNKRPFKMFETGVPKLIYRFSCDKRYVDSHPIIRHGSLPDDLCACTMPSICHDPSAPRRRFARLPSSESPPSVLPEKEGFLKTVSRLILEFVDTPTVCVSDCATEL
jgi:hypothetical protein